MRHNDDYTLYWYGKKMWARIILTLMNSGNYRMEFYRDGRYIAQDILSWEEAQNLREELVLMGWKYERYTESFKEP